MLWMNEDATMSAQEAQERVAQVQDAIDELHRVLDNYNLDGKLVVKYSKDCPITIDTDEKTITFWVGAENIS